MRYLHGQLRVALANGREQRREVNDLVDLVVDHDARNAVLIHHIAVGERARGEVGRCGLEVAGNHIVDTVLLAQQRDELGTNLAGRACAREAAERGRETQRDVRREGDAKIYDGGCSGREARGCRTKNAAAHQ